MRALAVVLLLLAPVLAGCTGGQEEKPVPPSGLDEPEEDATYRVRVLVVDDEYFPIPQADVYIMELARNATTDRLGDAFFEEVPSGEWTVYAEADRHLPNRTLLTLTPEEEPEARLTLRDRPPDLYLADFRRAVGMCAFGAHTGTTGPIGCEDTPFTPSSRVEFVMEANLEWALFEVEWEDQGPTTERMRFEIGLLDDVPFADGSDRILVEGESPVRVFIEPDNVSQEMKQRGNQIFVEAHPAEETEASAYTAQYFDVFAELVYFKAGARPDGTTRSS